MTAIMQSIQHIATLCLRENTHGMKIALTLGTHRVRVNILDSGSDVGQGAVPVGQSGSWMTIEDTQLQLFPRPTSRFP